MTSRMPFGPSRGLTLFEMMIAAGVIAVGILGMIALFQVCQMESERAGNERLAANCGEGILEHMEELGFVQMVALDGSSYYSDESGILPSVKDVGASLKGLQEGEAVIWMRNLDASAATLETSGLVEVTVIVQWMETERIHRRTFTRLFGR